jgi:HPt (histidine-containing phosphotransfer) domain-containing protein
LSVRSFVFSRFDAAYLSGVVMSDSATTVYDKAQALERLAGDAQLFAEMAGMFVADSESYCQALEKALASGDASALSREAHTVKSLLATFAYEAGRQAAMRLEYLAASGSLDGAAALTAEVVAAVRRLRVALAVETP